jgi:hypothetical protein
MPCATFVFRTLFILHARCRAVLVENALPQDTPWLNHVRMFLRSPFFAALLDAARLVRVDHQRG